MDCGYNQGIRDSLRIMWVIDSDGYRSNVGIVISNQAGQVLWARRIGQHSWQFPQGGINAGESPEQAMYRELYEEVGLKPENVTIVATSRSWLRYRLPKRLIREGTNPVCIGQKQRWFLLRLTSSDDTVNLGASGHPEFDEWRWVSYWYPVRQVVSFKREVYRKAMKEFVTAAQPPAKERRFSKDKRKRRRKSQTHAK